MNFSRCASQNVLASSKHPSFHICSMLRILRHPNEPQQMQNEEIALTLSVSKMFLFPRGSGSRSQEANSTGDLQLSINTGIGQVSINGITRSSRSNITKVIIKRE